MDTDFLSEEAYNAIIVEAAKFNSNLTLHFGLLASDCNNENDYIEQAEQLINEMKEYDENDIDDLFFGEPPEISEFHEALKKISDAIYELKKIPFDERTFE